MRINTLILFMVLIPGINKHATAENPILLVSESEFFADILAVETVTRLPQPKSETPAAVTILDRDIIKASGARDLADVFRLVPGFQVAYRRGHRPAVTYHGLGDEYTRRMQILVDGRSVYGALFGHVSWYTQGVAIEDIERIEVTRGPNTVTYGANAFLGTINIITRDSAQEHGITTKIAAGDHDIRDALVRYSTGFDGGDIRITAAYAADDGLNALPDDNELKLLNIRSDLHPNARDSILLQAGGSQTDPQEGFFGSTFAPPVFTSSNAHFEQIRWQRILSSNSNFSLQFSHNFRDVDFSYVTAPIPLGPFGIQQIPVSYDGTAHTYDIEFQHVSSPFADWRLVWGAGAREDEVESPVFFSGLNTVKSSESRLFGNTEWRATHNTIINAGLMWEDTEFTGDDVSPRLAVNHHLNNNHTARIVWSKAKRTPSLFEEKGDLQFNFMGITIDQIFDNNGDLEAETMTSYEIGYLGQFPSLHTSLDVRVYQDRITDLINQILIPATDLVDGQSFDYSNGGEITIEGVDLELTYRPMRDTRVILTYANMNASVSGLSANSVYNQQIWLDTVPDYSGSLMLMHRFLKNWYASVAYYKVGSMLWLDGLFLGSGNPVDAYQRLDIRIARQFKIGDTNGELAAVIQNAGTDYQDFYRNQFFEQRVYATLTLSF